MQNSKRRKSSRSSRKININDVENFNDSDLSRDDYKSNSSVSDTTFTMENLSKE